MSDLEEYIISIFKKDKIKFKREIHFKDCAGGKYRYDFEFMYNNKPILLEIDGIYHFKPIKGKTVMYRQQEHDRKKDDYCLGHNLPLYRIPYWEVYDITTVDEIFKPRYQVRRKGHNDYIQIPEKV